MKRRGRHLPKILSGVALATAACGLVACSALPGQGPSASDVSSAASSAPSVDKSGYVIVDIKPSVVSILTRKKGSSFHGTFGDRRPPPEQVIGVGDSVAITIWEAAAGGLFSSPVVDRSSPGSHTAVIPEQVVARDGSITVPYAGRINVAGLTTYKVERKIVTALSGKAIEPQVLASVTRNVSNSATVSGEVTNGARVGLTPRGDRILDVVASAGGIRAPVHETFITVTRSGRSATVPMQVLLANPAENIFVWPGDTLTLVRKPQSFTAFGATGRNAMVTFDAQGITLEEALAKAGGLIDLQADPSGVFLLRAEPVSIVRELDPAFPLAPGQKVANVVYRIDLRDTNTYFDARRFTVMDKDIVYVASSPSNELAKFLMLAQTLTSSAYTAKVVGQ